jgi:hypothetical protein
MWRQLGVPMLEHFIRIVRRIGGRLFNATKPERSVPYIECQFVGALKVAPGGYAAVVCPLSGWCGLRRA